MTDAPASLPSGDEIPNPYLGTEAFRTGDKLFGRDSEIVDFANRLQARRVVVLHSPSGAGKTSLVQAGLIPVLNKKEGLHVLPKVRLNNLPAPDGPNLPEGREPAERALDSLPPGQARAKPNEAKPSQAKPNQAKPNRYLLSALLSLDAGQGLPDEGRLSLDELAALSLKPSGLAEYLEAHAPYAENTRPVRGAGRPGSQVRRLLFFDQFEEVLTLDPTDGIVKKAFFAGLAPVLSDYRYMVIFAMREEYVAGLEPYLIYFPDRLSARFRLDLLGQPAALEAVRKPARRVRVPFAKKAAEKLVEELSMVTVREGAQVKKIPGPYVEPVQLQVVCRDLFERRNEPHRITREDVDQLGSVENALGAYYEKKIKQIAGGEEVQERRLRDWIEAELIIAGSLRGQAAAGEEIRYGLDQAALDKLIAAFLVREEPRRSIIWYELAHDSLVRPIIQSNATWRELHASEFELQASRWAKAPEEERRRLFPPVEVLRRAVAWGEERLGRLAEAQLQYLDAARKELQRLESRQDDRTVLGHNLEDTGWGVIFATDAPSELREALAELLDHRQEQASRKRMTYYREFFGANGYRPGETAQQFLGRYNAGSGPANPERMPYYLLIVGDPEVIPFEFQYGLDAQYAVGRIAFDTLEEYARYARSVVMSEREQREERFHLPNRMVLFAPQHEDDRATAYAREFLINPLLAELSAQAPNWKIEPLVAEQATKANLTSQLSSPQAPALVFTSTYGAQWPKDHPDQFANQGALVCQEWDGSSRGLKSEVTFSAQDASDQMNLLGTILFAYGACTAGTPAEDNFSSSAEAKRIASKAFLARLAQKLLCLPQGGCLAVIGHVDQAWSNSFLSEEGGNPTSDAGVFVKTLSRLMQGATAGLALEDFNRRYSYFTSLLAEELIAVNFSNQPRDNRRLLLMRNQTIDARNYILLGDPAVRLPVHSDQPYQELPADWSRPQIGPVRAPEWVAPATGAQEGAIEMPGSGLPEGTLQPEEAFQTGGTLRAEPAPRSVKPREIQPPGETSAVPKGMTPDPLAQVSLDHIAQALLKGQKIKLPGEKQGREHKVEKSKNPGL